MIWLSYLAIFIYIYFMLAQLNFFDLTRSKVTSWSKHIINSEVNLFQSMDIYLALKAF